MIILGIDPGLAACGMALVRSNRDRYVGGRKPPWEIGHSACLTVRTAPPRRHLAERLKWIRDHAYPLIGWATLLAVEDQSGAITGAQKRGHHNASNQHVQRVVGELAAMAHERGIPVVEPTPQQAKRVTGNARATKQQVKRFVQALPGCPSRLSQHAADAVCIAIAGHGLWRANLEITR